MMILPPARGLDQFRTEDRIVEREEGAVGWVDTGYSLYMHGCPTM
jgi:hypothetical protein